MLLPAHYAIFQNNKLSIVRYWEIPTPGYSSGRSEQSYIDELVDRFEESVKLRLRSDVEIGAFLSGGVDSGAICAIAAKEIRGLRTFSVGFDGEEAKYSELPFAKIVANKFNIQHKEIVLNDVAINDVLNEAIWAMDQPTIDGFNSYFVSAAVSKEVKVALSGIGGDELFCGYPRVQEYEYMLQCDHRWSRYFMRTPEPLVRNIAIQVLRNLNGVCPRVWLYRLRHLTKYGSTKKKIAALIGSLHWWGITEEEVMQFFTGRFRERIREHPSFSIFIGQQVHEEFHIDPVELLAVPEIVAYMQNVLLRDMDAMSMSHSLEVRVPFLDHPFVEFAMSIPSNLKRNGNVQKYILKKALETFLPKEILYRSKQGFNLPYGNWLKKSLRSRIENLLSEDNVKKRGIFHWPTVRRQKRLFFEGRANVQGIWSMVVLELWLQTFLDNVPRSFGQLSGNR